MFNQPKRIRRSQNINQSAECVELRMLMSAVPLDYSLHTPPESNADGIDQDSNGESSLIEGGLGRDNFLEGSEKQIGHNRTVESLFTLDIGTVENLTSKGQGQDNVIIGSTGLNGLISLDLDGGEGNDLFSERDNANVFQSRDVNNTMIGGRGNNIVIWLDGEELLIVNNGDGSDFLDGGEGNDTFQDKSAGFRIDPNGERFRTAELGFDILTGGDGDDTLKSDNDLNAYCESFRGGISVALGD